MAPLVGLTGLIGRDDFHRVVLPFVDEVHGDFVASVKNIPAAKTVLFVHAREDASSRVASAGAEEPHARAERLIFFKVAEIAEVNRRTIRNLSRRTVFAFRFPHHVLRQRECLRFSANKSLRSVADAFAQWNLRYECVSIGFIFDAHRLRAHLPFFKGIVGRCLQLHQLRLRRRNFRRDDIKTLCILANRQHEHWRGITHISVGVILRGVSEKGGHRVKVACRDRVEFVVMALRTVRGQAEPYPRCRLHAILRIVREIFLGDGAAFRRGDVAAMEARRDQLLLRRIGQKIAADLLHGEFVEALVSIESVNHPFAVGPDFAVVINVLTVCVAVTRRIEPVARAMFAVARRGQEFVHQLIVGVWRFVLQEFLQLFRRWRKARDVERYAACKRALVRLRRWLESA